MPELPEVETVRRGLMPILEGATIVSANIFRADLRYPFPENLCQRIGHRQIIAVKRRAKYLLIELSGNLTLVSHLGMSGAWRIEEAGLGRRYFSTTASAAHDHFSLTVQADSKKQHTVIYNDPRRFGMILLVQTDQLLSHRLFAKLGIEPLGNELSGEFLQREFHHKHKSLKAALLDQTIIAGLGNIYVCEALWRSLLSPFCQAARLAAGQQYWPQLAENLALNIRDVLNEAINAGGSTLRDYKHVDGELGYFQHNFSVYGREKQPCPRCGTAISRVKQNGRSTFYCDRCQNDNNHLLNDGKPS